VRVVLEAGAPGVCQRRDGLDSDGRQGGLEVPPAPLQPRAPRADQGGPAARGTGQWESPGELSVREGPRAHPGVPRIPIAWGGAAAVPGRRPGLAVRGPRGPTRAGCREGLRRPAQVLRHGRDRSRWRRRQRSGGDSPIPPRTEWERTAPARLRRAVRLGERPLLRLGQEANGPAVLGGQLRRQAMEPGPVRRRAQAAGPAGRRASHGPWITPARRAAADAAGAQARLAGGRLRQPALRHAS
jgi:hypothetical protein